MSEQERAEKIKTLVAKGDRASAQAEEFYKAAGAELIAWSQEFKGVGAKRRWIASAEKRCGLKQSRVYELVALAKGKITLDEQRERMRKRQSKSRGKNYVTSRKNRPTDDRPSDKDILDRIGKIKPRSKKPPPSNDPSPDGDGPARETGIALSWISDVLTKQTPRLTDFTEVELDDIQPVLNLADKLVTRLRQDQ